MALAAELVKLKEQSGTARRADASGANVSVLFERREAAQLPLEDVAALAANGALQLSRLDKRFSELESVLFSGKVVDRYLLDKEKLAAVESAVKKFCLLASPYFLLKPTEKCIEWLLRGWSCADSPEDVTALIYLALPYHETPLSVRLIHVLLGRPESSKKGLRDLAEWHALRGIAKQNKPMSQDTIAGLPGHVLRGIAKTALRAAKGNVRASALFSLYAMVTSKRVLMMTEKYEELRKAVLVDALDGLSLKLARSTGVEEFKIACVIVINSVAETVVQGTSKGFGLEAFTAAAEVLAKTISEISPYREQDPVCRGTLTCLVNLCASTDLKEMPESTFRFLVKLKDLGTVFSQTKMTHGSAVKRLVGTFGLTAAKNSLKNPHYLAAFIDLMLFGPLDEDFTDVLDAFLRALAVQTAELGPESRERVVDLLRKLARSRYARETDAAVSRFLKEGVVEHRDRVVSCIMDAFVDTQLQQLSSKEEAVDHKSYSSLLTSLDSSQPEIRLEAVKALNDPKKASQVPPNTIKSKLLKRIVDDDVSVQIEALENERLRTAEYAADVLPIAGRLLEASMRLPAQTNKKLVQALIMLVGAHTREAKDIRTAAAQAVTLLRCLVLPRDRTSRRKFQKPAIEALSSLGGDYAVLADAFKGMPRSTEAGEKDLCYAEKSLAKALAAAASRSKPVFELLTQSLVLRRPREGFADVEESWWWLWISKELAVVAKQKGAEQEAASQAMACLLSFQSGTYDDHDTKSSQRKEEDLNMLLERASTGNVRSLEIAAGRIFAMCAETDASTDGEEEMARAFEVLSAKGLFRSLQELFAKRIPPDHREDLLRKLLYGDIGARRSSGALAILAAHRISAEKEDKDANVELLADVAISWVSEDAERRLAADRARALMERHSESMQFPEGIAKACRGMLEMLAAKQNEKAKAKRGRREAMSEFLRGASELLPRFVQVTVESASPRRAEELLQLCVSAAGKDPEPMTKTLVPLVPILRRERVWNSCKCRILDMYREQTMKGIWKDEQSMLTPVLALAKESDSSQVQKSALDALKRLYAGAPTPSNRVLFRALLDVMSGGGGVQSARKARETLFELGECLSSQISAALDSWTSRMTAIKSSTKKRRASQEEENSIAVRSVMALLENLQTSEAATKLVHPHPKEVVRSLFDALNALQQIRKMKESEQRALPEAAQEHADEIKDNAGYLIQLALQSLSVLATFESGRSGAVRVGDVRSLIALVQEEDEYTRVVNVRAIELLQTIAKQQPLKVGPEIVAVVKYILDSYQAQGKATILRVLRSLLVPVRSTKVDKELILREVMQPRPFQTDADVFGEIIYAAVDALGTEDVLGKVLGLWLEHQGTRRLPFKGEAGLDGAQVFGQFPISEQLAAIRLAISDAATDDEDQATRVVTLVQSLIRSSTFLRMMSAIVDDDSVQDSLQELAKAVLVRKSNLDGDGRLGSAIDALLEGLAVVISAESAATLLQTLLEQGAENLSKSAVRFLLLRLEVLDLSEASSVVGGDEVAFGETSISLLRPLLVDEKLSNELRQLCVAAVDRLCTKMGSSIAPGLMTTLKPALALANSKDVDLSCTALLCLAALADVLGTRVVSIVPGTLSTVVRKLEESFNSGADLGKNEIARNAQAAVVATKSFLKAVPQFFSGESLERLLSFSVSDPMATKYDGMRVLDDIAAKTEPRFFLPAAASVMGSKFSKAKGEDAESCVLSIGRLLRGVLAFITDADRATLKKHRMDILALLLRSMELRRRLRLKSTLTAAETHKLASGVEDGAVACLLGLTMKVREGEFKDVYFKLVEWSESAGRSLADQAARSLSAVSDYVDRMISFQKCTTILLMDLKSIFAPYFESLIDRMLEMLKTNSMSGLVPDKKAESGRKRKRASLGTEGADLTSMLRVSAELACEDLSLFFTHSEEAMASKAFDKTTEGVISCVQEALVEQDLLDDLVAAFGARSLQGSADAEDGRRRLATINRLVLTNTRDRSPVVRKRSVSCILSLARRLGEDYLTALPEAMPFLADLIDDEDSAVEDISREFVRHLEEVSGEQILSQLKD